MTKVGHTPGPWEHQDNEVFAVEDGTPICSICVAITDEARAVAEADARLIAAAPDLFEALRAARSQVVTLGGEVIEHNGKIVSDAIQAAVLSVIDAALSKATSEG